MLGDMDGDIGDKALDCSSWGFVWRGGAVLALSRDGGGLRSGDVVSVDGDGAVDGGTTVASDFWLPDLCRGWSSGLGGCASSLAPFSSASSVISINRRRRRELDEDVMEVDAVWSRQAEDSALSVSSAARARGRTVSLGVNLSRKDPNCTLLRAATGISIRRTDKPDEHTLDEARQALGHVSDHDLPAAVLQEAIQR